MLDIFSYKDTFFFYEYDQSDSSGLASIIEIAEKNDYILDRFINQKNKHFIDIGANLGIATIIMAKLNPESTIYAFEPFSKTYNMLLRNIELNGLKNVKPFRMAVSNKENKTLNLITLQNMSGANSTYADLNLFKQQYVDSTGTEIVDCISFDEILEQNHIDQVFLLKIDCEGAEFDIIYDSELFKKRVVQNIVGEFHDLKYNSITTKSDDLIEYCKKYIAGEIKVSVLII